MSLLLTIAGTDPSGGAGIQADLNVFRDYHSHGLSCVTAVLAQNTTGVYDIHPLPPDVIKRQLDAILDDFAPKISAIKIGLLPTPEIVVVVAQKLRQLILHHPPIVTPIVLDPVLASGTNNAPLTTTKTVDAIKNELASLTTIITPNYPEALVFTEHREKPTEQLERQELIRKLVKETNTAILLKGGHLDENSNEVTDIIGFRSSSFAERKTERAQNDVTVKGLPSLPRYPYDVRGTGCQLSSAIASEFIAIPPTSDENLVKAVVGARLYLHNKLRDAHSIGQGRRVVTRTSDGTNKV